MKREKSHHHPVPMATAHRPPSETRWSSASRLCVDVRGPTSRRRPRAIALFCVLFAAVAATPARSVLLGDGDGAGNLDLAVVSVTKHVGAINGATGTYLGDGWVLTANHVGPGDIELPGLGQTLTYFSGSAIRLDTSPGQPADLLMFRIYPIPDLPRLEISDTAPEVGTAVLMVGNGRDRGAPITFDPFGPDVGLPEQNGWDWAATSSLRWGLNTIEYISQVPILNTNVFMTKFDETAGLPYEGQAALGDSGGAVFVYDPAAGARLAGVMLSVSLEFGQDSTSTIFTNETIIASLDGYAEQIEQNITNAPEPTGGLIFGVLALALGSRFRSRRAS
jgi:hypothetical protein